MSATVALWHSASGGPWHEVEAVPGSLAVARTAGLPPGRWWEDEYGNRYARERPEEPAR